MTRTLSAAAAFLFVLIGIGVFIALRPSEPRPRGSPEQRSFASERHAMVRTQIAARGVDNVGVLAAMRTVLRHEFVPRDQIGSAYSDRPLPIGFGQTISQPYTSPS
jgi:hypothetical protein